MKIGSGWYLRGDLGLAVYQGGRGHWRTLAGAERKWYDDSFGIGGVFGVGAGYYFNEHFRFRT
ncbi:hypothetical protein [uncultured Cohaesibacter sp.]|uniref:hypothetical protein n=1 Tax=uncultured Cohaesibacter sp. TaxID=1002546 RepID=UPI0029C97568|nr:hypothetical protein [uncultured Cohaesibacter sp.]